MLKLSNIVLCNWYNLTITKLLHLWSYFSVEKLRPGKCFLSMTNKESSGHMSCFTENDSLFEGVEAVCQLNIVSTVGSFQKSNWMMLSSTVFIVNFLPVLRKLAKYGQECKMSIYILDFFFQQPTCSRIGGSSLCCCIFTPFR